MFNNSIKISFVLLMFIFSIMSFPANKVLAMPSVIEVSGSFIHDQSVTVSGSGFGTKSPAAPLVWQNHESCTTNASITSDCGYAYTGGPGYGPNVAYTKTDRHYGNFGSKAARLDCYPMSGIGNDSCFPEIGHDIPGGSLEIYMSHQFYWTRYVGPGGGAFIFKLSRGGATPYYSGVPKYGVVIRPGSDGIDYGGDTHIVTAAGNQYRQNWPSPVNSDKWNRQEYHYKLSNPAGTANGAFEWWVNGIRNDGWTNVVTRASSESENVIKYIMTSFDGIDQYGLTNGYYLYMDDYYLDITQARVEICSGSTWANRGKCEIQPPTAWDANGQKIIFTVNGGAIPASANQFLYVVDSTGIANSNGYAITFGGTPKTGPIPNAPRALTIQ